MTKRSCEKHISNLLLSDPLITFLTLHTNPAIICSPCTSQESGYDPLTDTIHICHPISTTRRIIKHALAHELVHSYDRNETKLNFENKRHLTCTEIRSSMLSGECGFWKEVQRGNHVIMRGFEKCVRRRVWKSISGRVGEEGKNVVEEVWKECFNDFAPFDEIY